jgi:hypothetical protein
MVPAGWLAAPETAAAAGMLFGLETPGRRELELLLGGEGAVLNDLAGVQPKDRAPVLGEAEEGEDDDIEDLLDDDDEEEEDEEVAEVAEKEEAANE